MSFSETLTRERGPSSYFLFEFQTDSNTVWRYTDADEDVFFGDNRYKAEALSFGDIEDDGTLSKKSLTVTAKHNLSVARVLLQDPPSFVTTLKIFEANFADPDRETITLWAGRVLNCAFESGKVTLSCEPASTSLSRPGANRNFQKPCPFALYSDDCRAPKNWQEVDFLGGTPSVWEISKPSSGFISAASYSGGTIRWVDDPGAMRYQTIIKVEDLGPSLRITLNYSLPDTYEPRFVRILKGCAHTETSCSVWHSNIANFGGFPFIPDDMPINKLTTFY